jgi:4-hydroxy-tetrahydrodipicolinate synthase
MSISGVWVATLTPVTPELRPDRELLTSWVEGLLNRGCDGVVVFGTTGEGTSFGIEDRGRALGYLAEKIDPHKLIAGVGCASLADTVALIRHAASSGVDTVLVLPPFYYAPSPEGVHWYFRELAGRVPEGTRILLYNIPQVSGVRIEHHTAEQLFAELPGVIVGVKDSTGEPDSLTGFLKAMPGGTVFAGDERLLPLSLDQGGSGTISGPANLLPGTVVELHRAAMAGGEVVPSLAELDAFRAATRQSVVPSMKALAAAWTGDRTWARVMPPLHGLDVTGATTLIAELAANGITGLG